MMGEFVFRNLFHRPVRTLIGVLAIAVEVTLVVTIVGLTSGMLQETAKRIEGIGADVMMQSPSAQISASWNTARALASLYPSLPCRISSALMTKPPSSW